MPRPALDCRGRIESISPTFLVTENWVLRKLGWRSSTVEQLICNQQVVGSSPIASSSLDGAPIYFSLY
jgi:hypothetical protein